ncbi:MAG TPA: 50S ribosomal protein L13 [Candidatus Acidoferrum sp.]|nr:50S ribosomal protein L13 [Candidatus Acidoferrum sp.]
MEGKTIVFDATDKILGRLASTVAKSVLSGNNAVVVNSEKAIITGSKKVILERYKIRVNLKEKENPEHSPYWSRRSDLLVKRIIRGMLPYRKPSGKEAFRRLKVYIGTPDEFAKIKPIEIESKNPKDIYVGYITIGELSKLLGYNANR